MALKRNFPKEETPVERRSYKYFISADPRAFQRICTYMYTYVRRREVFFTRCFIIMNRLFLNFRRNAALLLLFFATILPHSSSWRIGKCCQTGDILVLNDTAGNFVCTRTSEQLQELLDPREDKPNGLPVCDESSYLVQILLEEIDQKVPRKACLEIFFDEKTAQNFPVIMYCNSVERPEIENSAMAYRNEEEEEEEEFSLPELPQIANFRKCCPGNSIYDIDRKFCINGDANFKLVFDNLREVDFIDAYNGPPTCEHALVDYKVDSTDIYNDGYAIRIAVPWKGRLKNVTIDMDNACLDGEASRSFIVARVCSEADYCLGNPCIRKCCPENKINIECLDPPENVSVENFRTSLASTAANATVESTFEATNYGLLVGRTCALFYADESEPWKIGSLGEIIVPDYPIFNYDNVCLEFLYNDSNLKNGLHSFFCFENDEYYIPHGRYEITTGLVLTSCIFLLITLLVYICLPSLQNLHGKTLMCHVVSLFFAYGCLAIIEITTTRILNNIDDYLADAVCQYLGYAMIFCFHSAFLWLNVMCFDIWWTFGGIQGAVGAATKRRHQRNRFLIYCGYAWGLAFVLTSLSAILEYAGLLESSIGRERCWFGNQTIAELVIFIGPITLTLLINTVFFIITSYRCSKVKAEIKRVMANVKDPTARKFHSDKTRLIMNLKLFVVMGIPWLLENVTAYLNHYHQIAGWLEELLYVADVINSLQGLWIFILFALKPKVYRALRKRLRAEGKGGAHKGSNNTLNVQDLHPVRKSSSNATLFSNLIVSSTVTV